MNRQSRFIGLAMRSSCGDSTRLDRCAESSPGNRFGQSLKMGMECTHRPNTSSATSSLSESDIRCITLDHSTIARELRRNRK